MGAGSSSSVEEDASHFKSIVNADRLGDENRPKICQRAKILKQLNCDILFTIFLEK